jgi:hypothetical protein
MRLSEHNIILSNSASCINVAAFETEFILVSTLNVQHSAQSVRVRIGDGKLITGVWVFATRHEQLAFGDAASR